MRILLLLIILIMATPVFGDTRTVNAIIGEAENQGYEGMLAVACAIQNRGTLKGVYGENAPRVKAKKYSKAILKQAQKAYRESLNADNCQLVGGATHWESVDFKVPYWAKSMTVTAKIGKHIFYRRRNEKTME